jgi:hypothetical protein
MRFNTVFKNKVMPKLLFSNNQLLDLEINSYLKDIDWILSGIH